MGAGTQAGPAEIDQHTTVEDLHSSDAAGTPVRRAPGSGQADQHGFVALSRSVYLNPPPKSQIPYYRVAGNGSIALLDGNGETANAGAGSHPLDESITPDGRFLYVLADGFGQIEAWRIAADGSLHHVGNAGSLPAGTVGLEAR